MSSADKQYLNIVENILNNGHYCQNRTGIATYKLPHQIMQFDLSKEFPILTTKFVGFKTAVKELLWIMNGNNSVKHLQDNNVRIWDEWMLDDGTIGTSYGWVIKKYDQVNKLISQLRNNPDDRRMVINLWQIPYLDTGALYPCVFNSIYDVTDGKLNCMLTIRSNDMPLGNPFNICQYAVFVHLLAQVCNLKVGLLTVCISNAHIYENQIEGMRIQLSRRNDDFEAPSLWLNPDIKEFKDFTIDDIKLINYKYHPAIKMEVAV